MNVVIAEDPGKLEPVRIPAWKWEGVHGAPPLSEEESPFLYCCDNHTHSRVPFPRQSGRKAKRRNLKRVGRDGGDKRMVLGGVGGGVYVFKIHHIHPSKD